MKKTTKELVTLPNGETCYKEYEAEALKIFFNAYNRAFDGENYEYAHAVACVALDRFLKD